MFLRWRRAPWWALAIPVIALCLGLDAVFAWMDHRPWPDALRSGAIMAVAVGAATAWSAKREQDRELTVLGALERPARDAALRAARGGPIPASDSVRAAAARLVRYRLDVHEDKGPVALATTGVFLLICLALVVAVSPWWWTVVASFAAVLGNHPWQGRRMRRRVVALQRPASRAASRP